MVERRSGRAAALLLFGKAWFHRSRAAVADLPSPTKRGARESVNNSSCFVIGLLGGGGGGEGKKPSRAARVIPAKSNPLLLVAVESGR